jgi:hypothetical protein
VGNNDLILAGVSGAGTDGMGVGFFGPQNTPLPTSTSATLNVALLDAGEITDDGVGFKPSRSTKEIKAAGSNQVQRVLVTEEKTEITLGFLETNEVSVAVYSGKALSAVTADGTGAMSTTYGGTSPIRYTLVIEAIDGANHTRLCYPEVEVSDRKERSLVKSGEVDVRQVTLTAYPDDNGISCYEYILVDALAGS